MTPRPEAGVRRPLDWRVGGVLLGLLSTLAVGLQGPLGVSGAYVTTESALAHRLAPEAAARSAYLAKYAQLGPEWFAVVGLVLGALAASLLSRTRRREDVPALWRQRFGAGQAARFAAAGVAGFLLLFGARLAGGCTSGHVISGMSQLALSGMVFAAAVFAAAIPVARAVYGGRAP